MFLMTYILNLIEFDIQMILLIAFIVLFVYKLLLFYRKVFILPPGPIPMPFLGNITYFIRKKEHITDELEQLADKYGPVYTFWVGTNPHVIINDVDIARDVFRQTNFAGRPESIFEKVIRNEHGNNIFFSDYGPQWETLRRVTHSAVLKYSTTDKLVYLVSDYVDDTIKTIIEREGLNKAFNPFNYIYNIILNILAASAFGQRYELDDPEYKAIKFAAKDLITELNPRIVFWELFPILTKIDGNFKHIKKLSLNLFELMKTKLKNHYKDYNESTVRDFCDALISAKNVALREGKESAHYLTDDNLTFALFDLFIGGTDTTNNTFRWILFLITYYPIVLKKLRKEIEDEVGDRIPTHEDRERCHYVMAVISETLRFRNQGPYGLPHKTLVTSKLGHFTIPEGTSIVVFQKHIMQNEKYWPKAHEFRPERFIENGKYVTTRPKAFIPFSFGRRVCLGEKLAIADLFLVLVRFIQKTSEYDLILHYSGDTKPDPNNSIGHFTKEYKISFNNISSD